MQCGGWSLCDEEDVLQTFENVSLYYWIDLPAPRLASQRTDKRTRCDASMIFHGKEDNMKRSKK